MFALSPDPIGFWYVNVPDIVQFIGLLDDVDGQHRFTYMFAFHPSIRREDIVETVETEPNAYSIEQSIELIRRGVKHIKALPNAQHHEILRGEMTVHEFVQKLAEIPGGPIMGRNDYGELTMFTLDDTTIGIWFITLPIGDYMAILNRKEDGTHHIQYRFRIYVDDKVHDSEDIKKWGHRHSLPNQYTDEQALEQVRAANEFLLNVPGTKVTEILRNGRTTEELLQDLMKQPFVHLKPVTMGSFGAPSLGASDAQLAN